VLPFELHDVAQVLLVHAWPKEVTPELSHLKNSLSTQKALPSCASGHAAPAWVPRKSQSVFWLFEMQPFGPGQLKATNVPSHQSEVVELLHVAPPRGMHGSPAFGPSHAVRLSCSTTKIFTSVCIHAPWG